MVLLPLNNEATMLLLHRTKDDLHSLGPWYTNERIAVDGGNDVLISYPEIVQRWTLSVVGFVMSNHPAQKQTLTFGEKQWW